MKLSGFPKTLQTALEEHKLDYAKRLFSDAKNFDKIKENVWDIIPVLTKHLTEPSRVSSREHFDCCTDLLRLTGELADPEDALLQILAEMEMCSDVTQFLALLEPFQGVLLRLKGKRGEFIPRECLNMFAAFPKKLPVPSYRGFNSRERLFVDNGDDVSNIIQVMSRVLKVIKTFISNSDSNWISVLIALLGSPMCSLNINLHNNVKTEAGLLSEEIVATIFQFTRDPLALFLNQTIETEYKIAWGNFFYFIYCEGACLTSTPKVYTAEFIFQTLLEPICCLLQEPESDIMVEKALKLGTLAVNNLEPQKLSYLYLEHPSQNLFCQLLCDLILLNSEEHIRKTALELLTLYCGRFEHKGFYLLVRGLLNELSHAGLKGYIITIFKERLVKDFPEYFLGANMRSLLKLICSLNEGLDEQFDQVVTTLNLLRYLALRDTDNVTGFWQFLPTLRKTYLMPLQDNIVVCKKAHEEQISKIHEKKPPAGGPDFSVTVGGSDVSPMELQEQIKQLNLILMQCDQVQSLLDRLNEIIVCK